VANPNYCHRQFCFSLPSFAGNPQPLGWRSIIDTTTLGDKLPKVVKSAMVATVIFSFVEQNRVLLTN